MCIRSQLSKTKRGNSERIRFWVRFASSKASWFYRDFFNISKANNKPLTSTCPGGATPWIIEIFFANIFNCLQIETRSLNLSFFFKRFRSTLGTTRHEELLESMKLGWRITRFSRHWQSDDCFCCYDRLRPHGIARKNCATPSKAADFSRISHSREISFSR